MQRVGGKRANSVPLHFHIYYEKAINCTYSGLGKSSALNNSWYVPLSNLNIRFRTIQNAAVDAASMKAFCIIRTLGNDTKITKDVNHEFAFFMVLKNNILSALIAKL